MKTKHTSFNRKTAFGSVVHTSVVPFLPYPTEDEEYDTQ